jgi:hypothetical protein
VIHGRWAKQEELTDGATLRLYAMINAPGALRDSMNEGSAARTVRAAE